MEINKHNPADAIIAEDLNEDLRDDAQQLPLKRPSPESSENPPPKHARTPSDDHRPSSSSDLLPSCLPQLQILLTHEQISALTTPQAFSQGQSQVISVRAPAFVGYELRASVSGFAVKAQFQPATGARPKNSKKSQQQQQHKSTAPSNALLQHSHALRESAPLDQRRTVQLGLTSVTCSCTPRGSAYPLCAHSVAALIKASTQPDEVATYTGAKQYLRTLSKDALLTIILNHAASVSSDIFLSVPSDPSAPFVEQYSDPMLAHCIPQGGASSGAKDSTASQTIEKTATPTDPNPRAQQSNKRQRQEGAASSTTGASTSQVIDLTSDSDGESEPVDEDMASDDGGESESESETEEKKESSRGSDGSEKKGEDGASGLKGLVTVETFAQRMRKVASKYRSEVESGIETMHEENSDEGYRSCSDSDWEFHDEYFGPVKSTVTSLIAQAESLMQAIDHATGCRALKAITDALFQEVDEDISYFTKATQFGNVVEELTNAWEAALFSDFSCGKMRPIPSELCTSLAATLGRAASILSGDEDKDGEERYEEDLLLFAMMCKHGWKDRNLTQILDGHFTNKWLPALSPLPKGGASAPHSGAQPSFHEPQGVLDYRFEVLSNKKRWAQYFNLALYFGHLWRVNNALFQLGRTEDAVKLAMQQVPMGGVGGSSGLTPLTAEQLLSLANSVKVVSLETRMQKFALLWCATQSNSSKKTSDTVENVFFQLISLAVSPSKRKSFQPLDVQALKSLLSTPGSIPSLGALGAQCCVAAWVQNPKGAASGKRAPTTPMDFLKRLMHDVPTELQGHFFLPSTIWLATTTLQSTKSLLSISSFLAEHKLRQEAMHVACRAMELHKSHFPGITIPSITTPSGESPQYISTIARHLMKIVTGADGSLSFKHSLCAVAVRSLCTNCSDHKLLFECAVMLQEGGQSAMLAGLWKHVVKVLDAQDAKPPVTRSYNRRSSSWEAREREFQEALAKEKTQRAERDELRKKINELMGRK